MLRWRLLSGTLLIAALVAISWLDHRAAVPGIWLAPAIALLAVLGTRELLDLYAANGLKPLAPVVYLASLLVLGGPWLSLVGSAVARGGLDGLTPADAATRCGVASAQWTLVALTIAVLAAFVGELARYQQPGRATANLAAALLAAAYLGLLPSFAVRLRLEWGIGALASLVIVVKTGDSGAYLFGKAFGRHKMAPALSPNKTIEGAIGALCFSLLGAGASALWIVPLDAPRAPQGVPIFSPVWGWALFGVLVGGFGILGDLAESLLKRDGRCKDSSGLIPGLGGVLDILDSVLVAAPVAYACWAFGLVGH